MSTNIRKDLYKLIVQKNMYLLVFHKTYNGGFGPAVSVYINDYEFLKFDCFGKNKGHYHIYDTIGFKTIYFNETDVKDQINKIEYELMNNFQSYLNQSHKLDIKNLSVDLESLSNQIHIMKKKMLEYETTYYSNLR